MTPQQILEAYLGAGAFGRNPDAVAALFTEDGEYEAPFVADGHPLRHLVGPDAIRAGLATYYAEPVKVPGQPLLDKSRYALHEFDNGFVAEIDTAFAAPDGSILTVSLVQIFRTRDDRIVSLRDYFSPAIA